jgi:hypothetical protein
MPPWTTKLSLWQTPQACTLSRTSPACGSFTSTSLITNFSFRAGSTAALQVFGYLADILLSVDAEVVEAEVVDEDVEERMYWSFIFWTM